MGWVWGWDGRGSEGMVGSEVWVEGEKVRMVVMDEKRIDCVVARSSI